MLVPSHMDEDRFWKRLHFHFWLHLRESRKKEGKGRDEERRGKEKGEKGQMNSDNASGGTSSCETPTMDPIPMAASPKVAPLVARPNMDTDALRLSRTSGDGAASEGVRTTVLSPEPSFDSLSQGSMLDRSPKGDWSDWE